MKAPGFLAPTPQKREVVVSVLFGLCFAASLLASAHLHLGDPFDFHATYAENYVDPLVPLDAAVYVALSLLCSAAAFVGYRLIMRLSRKEANLQRIPVKYVLLLAAILFAVWLPYLLAYWPGLVFADTMSSFRQLGGSHHWSNQHPVPYTLFIGACLMVGRILGNYTLGVAFYSIVQMLLMAGTLSFAIAWAKVRANLHWAWAVAFVALFGLLPSFATYSIALWKDPLFSCALVLISVLVAEAVLTRGEVARRGHVGFYLLLAGASLVAVFFRNNGMFITALLCVAFLLFAWRNAGSRGAYAGMASVFGGATLAAILVVSVVYPAVGVSTPQKESVGIPLAQMVNVVAKDGVMDEDDKTYLEQLIPAESVKEKYTPCLVDSIKNRGDFNRKKLRNTQEFLARWAKLGVQNPDFYLEAWMLQTFGFWSASRVECYAFDDNIKAAMPRNISERLTAQLAGFGVNAENLLGGDEVRTVLALACPSPPVGLILWAMLYACACLAMARKSRLIAILLPALGLVATLLLATPMWYWPRYALAVQLLIPLVVALFALLPAPLPEEVPVKDGVPFQV